jgi:uncharacterized protein YdhG (YjbR/CyaY superfamily)
MPKRREVDRWFSDYDDPMKEVVAGMREVVLAVDPRVDECIKWQAPTFTYQGNIASFFPRSKKHASLMFHQGAKIPGKHPRLEGSGDTSRVMKIGSLSDLRKARRDLENVIRAWVQWKDAPLTPTVPSRKKVSSKTTANQKPAGKKKIPRKKTTAKTKKTWKKKAPGTKKSAKESAVKKRSVKKRPTAK